jgi:hypothetical protein
VSGAGAIYDAIVARILGVAYFFGVLFVADRSLARWGSATIRTRPRNGLRLTIVFVALMATYTLLALLARWVADASTPLAWAVVALAAPACALSAVAIDRVLPEQHGAD